jgi:hypothetical protein
MGRICSRNLKLDARALPGEPLSLRSPGDQFAKLRCCVAMQILNERSSIDFARRGHNFMSTGESWAGFHAFDLYRRHYVFCSRLVRRRGSAVSGWGKRNNWSSSAASRPTPDFRALISNSTCTIPVHNSADRRPAKQWIHRSVWACRPRNALLHGSTTRGEYRSRPERFGP